MRRAVRMVLRLAAAGIVLLGGMGIGLEMVRHRMQGAGLNWWKSGLSLLAILAGLFLFLASSSLAEQLTDDVEDDDDANGRA